MSDHIKTVKSRVILFLVMFAIVITVLALLFSFNLIYRFQKRIAVRSAEFNLQLVAGLVAEDLRDITALARWCGYSEPIAEYFLADTDLTARSMDAWYALSEQYINNRSGRYVRRLIVFDTAQERFLQVGNQAPTSYPVTVYNLWKIFATGVERNEKWQPPVADPYFFSGDSPVIPFVQPVYNSASGGETGTVFLAATADIITDKLRSYRLPEGSRVYLDIDDTLHLVEDERVVPAGFSFRIAGGKTGETLDAAASAHEARDGEGRRYTLVSYPVREGITLIQALRPVHFIPLSGTWLAAGFGTLIVLLVLMAWGVNRMAGQISDLMDRLLLDEANKRDLEYRMLQSQINPHFLYNTLNSIKWMAVIQNAAGIAEMTTALSRFLKILSKDIRRVVPLRDELALLDDYLIIQKYRYGGSVSFENRLDDALLDTPIPRFTLQPLAENAIFHGIEPKGAGNIILSAERKGTDVLLTLADNGAGMDGEIIAGTGIQNVDERLRYAFGRAYGLSITSEEGKGTAVTIRLPAAEASP